MRPAALRLAPAALLLPAGAWLLGSDGVSLAPWAAAMTVAVAVGLLLGRLRYGSVVWRSPHTWLAGLVVWLALAAILRPVAPARATALLATTATALLLSLVAGSPIAQPWARLTAIGVGSCTAVWLLVQRLAIGARPDGPFGNPNLSAAPALLGLCLAPFIRGPAPIRFGVAALCAAGVAASGSRGALLGAVVAVAVWLATGSRTLRRVGIVVIALAGIGLAWRFATDRDPLRYGRVALWSVAIQTARAEWPWGAGPGGYEDAAAPWNYPREGELARFGRVPSLAESDLLQAAASLGLPGVLLIAGLVISVGRRLRGAGPAGQGLVAALLVTSAVNTQLVVPAVAWSATLGLTGVLPGGPGRRLRLPLPTLLAGAAVCTVVLVVALASPAWFLDGRSVQATTAAERALRGPAASDTALADAEAGLIGAVESRPRNAAGWRLVGEVRLRRAALRHEAGMVSAALDAFRRATEACPVDAWAALGEARSLRLLGDRGAARRAVARALSLEPNMQPGWLELGVLALEEGDVTTARDASGRIAALRSRWNGTRAESGYEHAMLTVDPVTLARLAAAVGPSR